MSRAAQEMRLGILGTASIAQHYWPILAQSEYSRIVAVGSRDLEKSNRFISECQTRPPSPVRPKAYGDYRAVLDDQNVDAVYVPLPTALRKEWVVQAAKAGKHVICEKPCAASFDDLAEMVEACRSSGVQFMDGVAFMHDSRLPLLERVWGDQQEFGAIARVTSSIGLNGTIIWDDRNIRYDPSLEPHGALGDMGWYSIRLSLWAMKEELPVAVTGRILSSDKAGNGPAAVIQEFSGELLFERGRSAHFHCSNVGAPAQWAVIAGTRAYVDLRHFLIALPDENGELGFVVHHGLGLPPRRCNVAAGDANGNLTNAANLFGNFSRAITAGVLNDEWPRRSLRTQLVMDACYKSSLLEGAGVAVDSSRMNQF